MADLSDIRIPKFADPVQGETLGDVYFEATSVSPDPIGLGSDEQFDVAHNPIVGGGAAAAARPPLAIYQVDDDNIGIEAGTVNNTSVDGRTDIAITTATRVWLKITLDASKEISTVEVHIPNSVAILTSTSSIAYVNIGRVYYSNGAITSVEAYANGSIGYNYGGSDYHFIYRI
jgi:hypothetical protein